MSDFNIMTKEEALDYCQKHADEFKADCYRSGDNGESQFDCLISIVEDGIISPSELPSYGMEY
jgi:hypothetical protein